MGSPGPPAPPAGRGGSTTICKGCIAFTTWAFPKNVMLTGGDDPPSIDVVSAGRIPKSGGRAAIELLILPRLAWSTRVASAETRPNRAHQPKRWVPRLRCDREDVCSGSGLLPCASLQFWWRAAHQKLATCQANPPPARNLTEVGRDKRQSLYK